MPSLRINLMPHFDHGLRTGTSELERIGQQVLKDLFHQHGIALYLRQIAEDPLHLPSFAFGLQHRQNFLHQRSQASGCQVQRMAADTRQVQQLIDQKAHLLRPCLNAIEVATGFGIERRTELFDQDLGKAADVAQRCAQIMGNGITKGFQFLVGCGQLRGAFGHPDFEFVTESADLVLIGLAASDVAEGGDSASQCAVFVTQGARADLNPGARGVFRIAHEHLGCAHLSTYGASERKPVGRERCRGVVSEKQAVVFGPLPRRKLCSTQTEDLFCSGVPEDKLFLLVDGGQPLDHAVEYGLQHARLLLQSAP